MFFKDDNESSNNTEKVTMREESCNQGKERKHAEYKGFEKVVKNMVPACEEVGLQVHKEPACEEEGLDKVPACKEAGPQKEPDYEEAGLDQEVFNQSNIGCEEVEVTEKKEKRGRERFDQDFARKGHKVGNLMKKVEKTNKKMEKLGRKKEGSVPIVSDGEQWFDASADLAKAGEGGHGDMEIKQGGCARGEVKKAEVQ